MLDRTSIRDDIEGIAVSLATKGFELDRREFERLDKGERKLRIESEDLRARRNQTSEEIARLKKAGEDASSHIIAMRDVSQRIKQLDEILQSTQERLQSMLAGIPNLPHSSVPVGPNESANRIEREVGALSQFGFEPLDHVELGRNLGILDTERAAKITGTRFALYYGQGAQLERALINFMLDLHTGEHGYREVLPPFMANRASFFGTGNLPKFEEDLFAIRDTDYLLIPTAEVPVTNLYAREVIEGEGLPQAFVAYTPCFRSEAGAYGRDTRGLIRQHQFNKVELVRFAHPDDSYNQLELLTGHAEEVLKRLGLPYRVVTLATGDTSFSSAKTYDLEVWVPSQDAYREISSCSNFEDFQARRAGVRFRPADGGKPRFAHTLNGSGLAIGRTWLAIIENYQQADGTVVVPEVLRPYMGGADRIVPDPTSPVGPDGK